MYIHLVYILIYNLTYHVIYMYCRCASADITQHWEVIHIAVATLCWHCELQIHLYIYMYIVYTV